jgi:hypothetical protein
MANMGDKLKQSDVKKGMKIGRWGVTKVTPKRVTIILMSDKDLGYKISGRPLTYNWDGEGYKRQGQYLRKNGISEGFKVKDWVVGKPNTNAKNAEGFVYKVDGDKIYLKDKYGSEEKRAFPSSDFKKGKAPKTESKLNEGDIRELIRTMIEQELDQFDIEDEEKDKCDIGECGKECIECEQNETCDKHKKNEEDELEEVSSVTAMGGQDGYQTPYAFAKRLKDRTREISQQLGYKLVNEPEDRDWKDIEDAQKESLVYRRKFAEMKVRSGLNESKRINVTFTTDGERKALLTSLKKNKKDADITELDGEFVVDIYANTNKILSDLKSVKKRIQSKNRGQSGIDIQENIINEGTKIVDKVGDYELQKVFRWGGLLTHIIVKNGKEIGQYAPNLDSKIAVKYFKQDAPKRKFPKAQIYEQNINEGTDETAKIYVGGEPWWVRKMGDTTHFHMANSEKGIKAGGWVSHIGQHKDELYYNDIVKWLKGGKINGKKYKKFFRQQEGIAEGRRGAYHEFRDNPDMNNRQKIGVSLRDVRNQLESIEKTIDLNLRLKQETGINTQQYWKNTHRALNKINEKMTRIINKVRRF